MDKVRLRASVVRVESLGRSAHPQPTAPRYVAVPTTKNLGFQPAIVPATCLPDAEPLRAGNMFGER